MTAATWSYRNVFGTHLSRDDVVRITAEHQQGPPQVRVLCKCGQEFWGITSREAQNKAWTHANDEVGYPLTAEFDDESVTG